MNKYYNLFAGLIVMLAVIILPSVTHAANLSFAVDSQQVRVGDVFVVNVNVDTSGQKINVAEASLYFDAIKLEVQDITTGGSVFNLWTRAPIYSNQTGKISFAGGTSSGFSGPQGNVLKIVFLAKQAGTALINFGLDSNLFLADGKGTQVAPHFTNAQIVILAQSQNQPASNHWDSILAGDKIPPQNLIVNLGKDPSVFGGKYFVSFSATDGQSGINYYAVKEGDGQFIQTESPYVLADQSLSKTITVKAVDKAGNFVTKDASTPQKNYWLWIAIAAIFALINVIWIMVLKKIKKS